MLQAKNSKGTEVFNDGLLIVLDAKDGIILKEKYKSIRYGEKTVGAIRFYQANVAGTEIKKLISVPFNYLIEQNDLVELIDFHTKNKCIYRIKHLEFKDTVPRSIYLTLVKNDILYTDNRKA